MKLEKILNDVEILNGFCKLDIDVDNISYNSKDNQLHSLFVCLPGKSVDGHDFAKEAIEKGALAIVCERDLGLDNQIIVKNSRKSLAKISANFFDHPSKKLKLIGVTGTKGKTTVSSFISTILNNSGQKTAQIGTLGAIFGDDVIETNNTTPESFEIQKLLRKAVDLNYKNVVIEASSIGLKNHRLDNLIFNYGIFTNISEDHIGSSEHESFDDYVESKSLLFKMCKKGFINTDDLSYKQVILDHSCRINSYGFSPDCQFSCCNYFPKEQIGSSFMVNGKEFEISVPGKYNVYNALASIAVCAEMGANYETIRSSLKNCKVRGRSEIVFKNSSVAIIIDYAHNSLGLENLLRSLREYHPSRIVTVFGAGGNRAKSRRYFMGKISGELSDLTIITSDNSRFENTAEIIDDIKKGIQQTAGQFVIIPDRRKAIEYCVRNAKRGDFIVLAGKGHETYQELNGVKYNFDERVIVNNVLSECRMI